jgi:hypothetical protein
VTRLCGVLLAESYKKMSLPVVVEAVKSTRYPAGLALALALPLTCAPPEADVFVDAAGAAHAALTTHTRAKPAIRGGRNELSAFRLRRL